MVPAARPGPKLRHRRVPGPPSQRSEQSYRQRGPRSGGLARRVLLSRRLATCGTTRTDVRSGRPVAGTPMRGATPTGVRHGRRGRFSRRYQCAIKGLAGITNQAGERMPARGWQHPTERRGRAVAFHGSGRHLRHPSGSCRHQPGGHRCPLPSGRCSPTGPGQSGLTCACCPHRPGLSPPRLSGHCLSRLSLSAPSLRPPSLSQRRTGQPGPSHHTRPQPHRRSPLVTHGRTALQIFRSRISTGCARR
jgi:hypothetical protein